MSSLSSIIFGLLLVILVALFVSMNSNAEGFYEGAYVNKAKVVGKGPASSAAPKKK